MSDILDSDDSGLSEDNGRIIQTDLRNEMSRSYLVCIPSILITPRAPNLESSTAVFTSTTLSIALAIIGTSLLKSPIDQEGSVKS